MKQNKSEFWMTLGIMYVAIGISLTLGILVVLDFMNLMTATFQLQEEVNSKEGTIRYEDNFAIDTTTNGCSLKYSSFEHNQTPQVTACQKEGYDGYLPKEKRCADCTEIELELEAERCRTRGQCSQSYMAYLVEAINIHENAQLEIDAYQAITKEEPKREVMTCPLNGPCKGCPHCSHCTNLNNSCTKGDKP